MEASAGHFILDGDLLSGQRITTLVIWEDSQLRDHGASG